MRERRRSGSGVLTAPATSAPGDSSSRTRRLGVGWGGGPEDAEGGEREPVHPHVVVLVEAPGLLELPLLALLRRRRAAHAPVVVDGVGLGEERVAGLRDLGLAEKPAQASLLETEWPGLVPPAAGFQAAAGPRAPLVQRVTQTSRARGRSGAL